MAFHDVSHPIESGMQVFPGDPEVKLEQAATIDENGYRVSLLQCGSHTGTHIDAPSHTQPDGNNIDGYSIDRFVFDAHVVDVRDKEDREPIRLDDLPEEGGDMLLLYTGWDEYWGTDRYLDHPYLSEEAARRCVEEGWSVGTDALNPDPTPTDNATGDEPDGFPVHHTLLGSDLFIIENLTNLGVFDQATLYAFPLPIRGCDGAPIRAVAKTDDT